MLALSLTGIWAASQPAVFTRRWVPSAPRITAHYFLIVSKNPDGTMRAFIRNPEFNAGAFTGTRELAVSGSSVRLRLQDRPDITGVLNGDGTISFANIPPENANLRFHRPAPEDLRWFYPRASAHWRYRPPQTLPDGWTAGTLSAAGMREAPIAALMQGIVSLRMPQLRSPYIQSISIARHGKLVLDEYFYGFTAGLPHDVRSAGKSVTTLIAGRAIADTHAFSPASRVLDLLPQYRAIQHIDARKRRMSVANLMTMASGLACDDNDDASPGNEDTMQNTPPGTDWYRYTLDLPMLSEPGTRAIYCTAGINLLGAVVQTQAHQQLPAYFRNRFAEPMQFGEYALWLMPPPASAAYMGGGDYMRPRDFLKFGQLLLDGGMWHGRRIVNRDWIRESIHPRTAPEGEGDRYGYGWHITNVRVDGRSYAVINAGGNGGQLMIAVPALDLAIMVTAGNYNQYPVWRRFLPEVVRAAVRSCER